MHNVNYYYSDKLTDDMMAHEGSGPLLARVVARECVALPWAAVWWSLAV